MENFTEEVAVKRTSKSLISQDGSLEKGIKEIVEQGFELFRKTPRIIYFRRLVYFM